MGDTKLTYIEVSQEGIISCEQCGKPIEVGDACYYHGDGGYTCSIKCADEYEIQLEMGEK